MERCVSCAAVVFLNARYLDPVLGRFISVDPLVDFTGDAYGYGNSNPISYSDPGGLAASRDPDCGADAVCKNMAPNGKGALFSKEGVYVGTATDAASGGGVGPGIRRTAKPICGDGRFVGACRPPAPLLTIAAVPAGSPAPPALMPGEIIRLISEILGGAPADVRTGGLVGFCGAASASGGLTFTGSACLVGDGGGIAAIASYGNGYGAPGVGASAGVFLSNARRAGDLRGWSLCGGGSAGTATAEVCGGLAFSEINNRWEFNGYLTFYLGVSTPGVEGHVTMSYTGVHRLIEFPWG